MSLSCVNVLLNWKGPGQPPGNAVQAGVIEQVLAHRQVRVQRAALEDDAQTRQAARNVPWATVMPVAGLNAYDILRHERLVIDAVALEPAQDDGVSEEAAQ